jgi:outer membrane protein OmpA-like peptidoglycan-associated protein
VTLHLLLALLAADPGTTVFPLLKIGQGPRAAAMGESFTGLADDATAIYWNPAGLAQLSRAQLALSHQQWFADIKDELGHAVLPLGPGTLGLGLAYSAQPDVDYWDESGLEFKTFTAWDAALSAGYGLPLSERYRLGASVTGLFEELKLQQGTGAGLDLAASGTPIDNLGLGLAARHLGYASFGSGTEKLPMEVAVGASYTLLLPSPSSLFASRSAFLPPIENRDSRLTVTLDGTLPLLDNSPNVRFGLEYRPFTPGPENRIPDLALRLGYRTGPVDLSTLDYLNGLTAGLGVTVGNFGVDYAFVPYGELGLTHRIGLRVTAPPRATGSLVVTVLDQKTGKPLPATISTSLAYDTTANTADITGGTTGGPAGELLVASARPGAIRVRASAAGYDSRAVTLTIASGRRLSHTFYLSQIPAGINGHIYDARTKEPISAMLEYSGPLDLTARDTALARRAPLTIPVRVTPPSVYRLNNLKRGTYLLRVSPTRQQAGIELARLRRPAALSLFQRRRNVPAYEAETTTTAARTTPTLTGAANDYLPQNCTLDIAPGLSINRDFYLWKKGDILYLTVNFPSGSAEIPSEFEYDVDRAGTILKQTPDIKRIELSGHTDKRYIETSRFSSNWELSQARADAVKKYMVRKFGIDPDRIIAKGYSDTKPIASNETPEGMYRNRRTELRILE